MSGYLIDTHILLWALFKPEKLSRTSREILEKTDDALFVSAISFWEISLKHGLGKLDLENCTPEQIVDEAGLMGLIQLPLLCQEAARYHILPRLKHKDPFDRMLILQAISRELTLVSRDRAFETYRPHGLKIVY